MIGRCVILGLAVSACTPPGEPPELPPPAEQAAPAAGNPGGHGGEITVAPGDLMITAPVAGARVASPLVVQGVAINSFFFEGVFPAELVVDGEVIAQAPAEQQAPDNWTTPGPVNFKATLTFDVSKETSAELVLREDMPAPASPDSDVAGPARTARIPIVLVPAN